MNFSGNAGSDYLVECLAYYCMQLSRMVRVRLRVWLASGYAHVFVLLTLSLYHIL